MTRNCAEVGFFSKGRTAASTIRKSSSDRPRSDKVGLENVCSVSGVAQPSSMAPRQTETSQRLKGNVLG
jgi:hypothetical protein